MKLRRGAPIPTGEAIPKYLSPRRVGNPIGTGRMGPVHEVPPLSGTQQVALAVKVLTPPFTGFDTNPAFRRDAQTALSIHGRNILGYKFFHEGWQADGLPPYIVMYRAHGTLAGALREAGEGEGKPWPLAELYPVICQLIAAMEVINQKVIHRDLTPFNILKVDALWKISDYGLSTLAAEAVRQKVFYGTGSYPFIAPEAWDNAPDAVTMDIYSLGMIFYQMATLRRPFDVDPDTAPAWEEAHRRQPVKPPHLFNPEIPPPLSQTILRMVEKGPRSRPPDWQAVWQFMASGVADSPINQLIRRTREESRQWESPKDLIERARKEETEALVRAQVAKRAEEYEAYKVRIASPEFQAEVARRREEGRLHEERKREVICGEANPFLTRIKGNLIRPLQQWADEQNQRQPEGKITTDLQEKDDGLAFTMNFPDGTSRKIEIDVLLERDFQVPYSPSDPRDSSTITEFPTIRDWPVRAFGAAALGDGRGFNLVFVQGAYYSQGRWMTSSGDWFVQVSRTIPSAQAQAEPEPFAMRSVRMLSESASTRRSEVRDYDVSHLRLFFQGVLPG